MTGHKTKGSEQESRAKENKRRIDGNYARKTMEW